MNFYALPLVIAALATTPVRDRVPKPTDEIVVDFAGVLPPADESSIRTVRRPALFDGRPIVELTIERLSDHRVQPAEIRRFSNVVDDTCGIGHADDPGALVVISRDDLRFSIAPGRGHLRAENVLQGIIDTGMVPHLKNGDSSSAILEGVIAVRDRLIRPRAERQSNQPPPERPTSPAPQVFEGLGAGAGSCLCIGFGLLFALMAGMSLLLRASRGLLRRGGGFGPPPVRYRRGRRGLGNVLGGVGTALLLGRMMGSRRRGPSLRSIGPRASEVSRRTGSGGSGSSLGGGRSSGSGAGGSW